MGVSMKKMISRIDEIKKELSELKQSSEEFYGWSRNVTTKAKIAELENELKQLEAPTKIKLGEVIEELERITPDDSGDWIVAVNVLPSRKDNRRFSRNYEKWENATALITFCLTVEAIDGQRRLLCHCDLKYSANINEVLESGSGISVNYTRGKAYLQLSNFSNLKFDFNQNQNVQSTNGKPYIDAAIKNCLNRVAEQENPEK